jgi:hypothetical protein
VTRVLAAAGRSKSRAYLKLQQLLGAVQRLKDTFHIDRTATLFAHKCLRIEQPHRFATFRTGHKLIGADGGDANGLRIATPQPRTELSQWSHGRDHSVRRTAGQDRRPVDCSTLIPLKSLPEVRTSECDIQHKIAFSKYI